MREVWINHVHSMIMIMYISLYSFVSGELNEPCGLLVDHSWTSLWASLRQLYCQTIKWTPPSTSCEDPEIRCLLWCQCEFRLLWYLIIYFYWLYWILTPMLVFILRCIWSFQPWTARRSSRRQRMKSILSRADSEPRKASFFAGTMPSTARRPRVPTSEHP